VLAIVAALPGMLGDGPGAETIWLIAIAAGLGAWGMWLGRLHTAQAPARRAAIDQAQHERRRELAEQARRAEEHAAYLAPRQVGNAWHHGACTINHRTHAAAQRCRLG
jgi:hypothetical protein